MAKLLVWTLSSRAVASVDGGLVIPDLGAVGGADLDQLAPLWRITSGMRKEPPISTSSPRETITSRSGPGFPSDEHGAGVVVDHQGGFGTGDFAEQVLGIAM